MRNLFPQERGLAKGQKVLNAVTRIGSINEILFQDFPSELVLFIGDGGQGFLAQFISLHSDPSIPHPPEFRTDIFRTWMFRLIM